MKIVTSALDHKSQGTLLGNNAENNTEKNTVKEDQDQTDHSERVSLPKLHSQITYLVQGDTYKNDLNLAFERLLGDANAPEYLAPKNLPSTHSSLERPHDLTPSLNEGSDTQHTFDPMSFGCSIGSVDHS